MDGLELHGQRSETAVAGQAEGRVLLKNLAVEMNTNVRSHVFGTNLQHLEDEGKMSQFTLQRNSDYSESGAALHSFFLPEME